jgi:dCMP deaminase
MTAKRISKDDYYLGIAKEVARRSTCFRRSIGALIVRDDQIISTGYVGAPRKTKSSHEHGFCLRDRLGIPHGERYELCRSVHAEQNAIINAARAGVSLLGGDMYIYGSAPGESAPINAFPCYICKKMLINCSLDRVVCSTADGGTMVFRVEEWIRDWQERDILDDEHQYGKDK